MGNTQPYTRINENSFNFNNSNMSTTNPSGNEEKNENDKIDKSSLSIEASLIFDLLHMNNEEIEDLLVQKALHYKILTGNPLSKFLYANKGLIVKYKYKSTLEDLTNSSAEQSIVQEFKTTDRIEPNAEIYLVNDLLPLTDEDRIDLIIEYAIKYEILCENPSSKIQKWKNDLKINANTSKSNGCRILNGIYERRVSKNLEKNQLITYNRETLISFNKNLDSTPIPILCNTKTFLKNIVNNKIYKISNQNKINYYRDESNENIKFSNIDIQNTGKETLNNKFIIQEDIIKENEVTTKEPVLKKFEEYINLIIGKDLNEEEKQIFKLPKYENREFSYFMSKKFTKLLEEFSQKCVVNNLGVIVEAEINADSANNEQALIRYEKNSCEAVIPSNLLLRRFAFHGDIVSCFVRKPYKSTKLKVANENNPTDLVDETVKTKNSNCLDAFVIKTIQKIHNRCFAGYFIRKEGKNNIFAPLNKKIPLISVLRQDLPNELLDVNYKMSDNTFCVVKIINWNEKTYVGQFKGLIKECDIIGVDNFIPLDKIIDLKQLEKNNEIAENSSIYIEKTTEESNDNNTFENREEKESCLTAEKALVIDLLNMSCDSEREEFLFKKALEYQILIKNKNTIIFNEKLLSQRNTFTKNKKDKQNLLPKKFEEYVNLIVKKDINEQQQKFFHFPDYKISNYFMDQKFTESLENFSQKCVANNLGIIVEAEINVNHHNSEEAYIRMKGNLCDAKIPNLLLRKCALDGDIVRCFVRKSSKVIESEIANEKITEDVSTDFFDKSVEIENSSYFQAFVIKIIKKVHNRRCVGTFTTTNKKRDYILFSPRNKKLPLIRIQCTPSLKQFFFNENCKEKILYEVEITDWDGTICMGKVIREIGKCDEIESEKIAILLNNNLYVKPYQEKFNKIFEKPLNINETDLLCRRDMRPFCVFTIDPLLAKDLDDALSIVQYPDGNFEVGIHIADVSHFIKENSELDNLIQKRTTSIYLVDEVFHMLPKVLCKKCALLPDKDRLTFSVFLKITPDAQIIETNIQKTIIKSCTQFAYEHAQKIIDNPEMKWDKNDFPEIFNGYTITDIAEKIKNLHNLATIFRKNRFENGCLSLNKPKISFTLDNETGEPTGFSKVVRNTANFLIEEFMILANQTVSSFIYKSFPSMSILRYHLHPRVQNLTKIRNLLKEIYGINLDISTSKALATSIQKHIETNNDPTSISQIIQHFLVKTMQKALYVCSDKLNYFNFYHYALAIPLYTHFTSPIRRYPDILVHRILNAAINREKPTTRTADALNEILNLCNTHKYEAKTAAEESIDFYFMRYIKTKEYLNMRSVIIKLDMHSCSALTFDSGHLIQLNFRDLKEISFLPKKESKTIIATFLKGPYEDKSFELKLCVVVWLKVYIENNKIKARFIMPPIEHDT